VVKDQPNATQTLTEVLAEGQVAEEGITIIVNPGKERDHTQQIQTVKKDHLPIHAKPSNSFCSR